MSNQLASYWSYWGKASREGAFHLLPYHALDVAACAHVYLEQHHPLRARLSQLLGIDEESLVRWTTFMLALHDVGKFGYRFQCLRSVFPGIASELPSATGYTVRHDTLGLILWDTVLREAVVDRLVPEASGRRTIRTALGYWMAASAGHHGQPPSSTWRRRNHRNNWLKDQFTQQDREAALAFCDDVGTLLLEDAPLRVDDPKAFEHALKLGSWWLAGIGVLCDWLGSNAELFTYQQEAMALKTYWDEHARPAAERALAQSGVLPLSVTAKSQQVLFPYLAAAQPTPLQQLCAELELSDSPQLLILEDLTGSGKTEASLTLAHRLQAAGAADGLYLALPTMATSNAMHRRIIDNQIYQRLFDEEPGLVLTHGASRLVQASAARDGVLPDAPNEGDYDQAETSAANLRAAWIGDHRKKALLADLGVGTIDQALLGVLPSRHQSLRLLGLSRKVLIVDEVHAYDAYMQELLSALLRFQAYIGGHVILLSATLPRQMRQALANAFRAGRHAEPVSLEQDAYPLLTQITTTASRELPVASSERTRREVAVACIDETTAALEVLLEAHRQNRCGCWIRNSVDDAIDAWQQLRAAGVPEDRLQLFHARFALGDRLAIERQVLAHFGPQSSSIQRQGQILIATQVVEQSLDLDFDVMVSDLAPIDLIIQRAGRLQRHRRDANGDLSDQEQRPAPCLYLVSPAATADADEHWLSTLLPRTKYVYQDLRCLWRTAHLLTREGAIRLPEAARTLVEGVYGEQALAAPEGIEAARMQANADADALHQRSMGGFNTLKLEQGYVDSGMDYWNDIITPTRLGDPTIRLRLARWYNGQLIPWGGTETDAWSDWITTAMSEISVRQSWLGAETDSPDDMLHEAVNAYLATVYDQGRWSRLLPLQQVDDEHWQAEALDPQGRMVKLCYHQLTGLERARES